ncbi:MAG: aminopeptidase N [SAR86 cluster bacterium]|uniref:Aminopeptidase N n=1 Tax=SAR86 cluster bacterium TaxID=2030880 RepID=A0A2A5BB92_9GAMM|nr:MAG: aminopeptidase N [SAR86 cluster bacterium]
MKNASARTTYLKDYRQPDYNIVTTDLDFDLYEDHAIVRSRLVFKRNTQDVDADKNSLVLHGQMLKLLKLSIDDVELEEGQYILDDESLTIPSLSTLLSGAADEFNFECHTRIEPQNNTALEGLYKSKKMFCTQCEAEGFRRITYYLDRPDVMSKFTTTITANREKYPVLLSNGNKISSGTVENDSQRHWVSWEDPFMKPSYLFALVAGDLVSLNDSFTTCSGRDIDLQIFVEEKDIDKCDHAMLSLKKSMQWDEEVFGREYDLDIFMIVAVDDFNMGAMENKGLNVFNTSCVLANPKTTTDLFFQRVEAVVAHEYFHNWSGNRVTCRDWFQLSLKEGFTVFRDSEFSADMGSRTVKRIDDVAFLQTVQFAEDGGPMAHSVRPDSYMEISNFYTVTIYEKGAEVVRMIHLILGAEKFRAGSDLYFKRHDGQAVTTEEFVKAMEDASGVDLKQFRNWYSQAGTPALSVAGNYNEKTKQYTLSVEQSCPDTPGQSNKLPFHIPLRIGLMDAQGREMPLNLSDDTVEQGATDRVLAVTEQKQQFVFEKIEQEPIPSLLRGFSAPVRLNYDYSRENLLFLMTHDSDGFNRWNASQLLAIDIIAELQQHKIQGKELAVPQSLIDAYSGVLNSVLDDKELDKAMVAQLLSLPTLGFLIERSTVADVEGIHEVREFLADGLARNLSDLFKKVYEDNCSDMQFSADANSVARRALKNLALSYLLRTEDEQALQKCQLQFEQASNMTDQLAALRCLVNCKAESATALKQEALSLFYQQWKHEPLVVDQWFVVQSVCQLPDGLSRVKALLEHENFEIRNPNKVRSVIGAFCGQNHIGFHCASGSGYEFLADQVLLLDKLNPQIASRLLTPLTRWKKFDSKRQALMQVQLQRIKAEENLSKDVFEIVEKSTV